MPSKLKIPLPVGFVAPGFDQVLNTFSDSFANGIDKGASFAAYYKGQQVVNIWGGLADEQVKRPWQEDTMSFFYSTTKLFAAVTIGHLVDRGSLSYKQKVSSIWPEFAQNGKENITLEMLLSCRAGLPVLDDNYLLSWMRDDPQKLADVLAEQKPIWQPGETHGYHPLTMGLYLDQIVQKVDRKKRNLSQYFHEEIAVPFGIDFYIGLPRSMFHRAARLEPQSVEKDFFVNFIETFKGDKSIYQRSTTQPKDWCSSRILNDPAFIELPCGSSHGVGTAAGVAKLSGILANGGWHEGKTLLTQDTIALLQEPLSHGVDLTMSREDIYGRGTMLQPVIEGHQHWFMFGHSGFGDQNSAADGQYKVGWAYVTNYVDPTVSYTQKHKWRPLVHALFNCVHQIEGVKVERKYLTSYSDLLKEIRKSKL